MRGKDSQSLQDTKKDCQKKMKNREQWSTAIDLLWVKQIKSRKRLMDVALEKIFSAHFEII